MGQQMLGQIAGHDHPAPIVHPSGHIHLPQTRIDKRYARSALLPRAHFGRICICVPRECIPFGLPVIRQQMRPIVHQVISKLAPNKLTSGHSLIVLFGGAFIIYTAIKEITHLLVVKNLEDENGGPSRSVAKSVFLIVLMNLVFSFDSILSAMALTDSFWIMATAIVISGVLMIWLADHVAVFLEKNRMYEVLGLFILFIVGILLVSEGGHLSHLEFFGYPVEAMSKSTFYFVLFVLVVVDVVQGQYQKKLMQAEAARQSKVA